MVCLSVCSNVDSIQQTKQSVAGSIAAGADQQMVTDKWSVWRDQTRPGPIRSTGRGRPTQLPALIVRSAGHQDGRLLCCVSMSQLARSILLSPSLLPPLLLLLLGVVISDAVR